MSMNSECPKQGIRWRSLAVGALLVFACPVKADVIIVESRFRGENHSRYQEVEGSWGDSQFPPKVTKSSAAGLKDQSIGSRRFQFHRTDQEPVATPPAAARFIPQVSEPGRYRVEMTYPESANAEPVYVVVNSGEGNTRKAMLQNGRGFNAPGQANRWHLIGEYDFAPGDDHYVEIRAEDDVRAVDQGSFGQVVADAMRFTRIEAPAMEENRTASSSSPGSLDWKTELEEARDTAEKESRRLLVYFDAASCESCRGHEQMMEHPSVREEIARDWVPVRLNSSSLGPRKLQFLGVFRAGTINLYDSGGRALDQITEPLTGDEFLVRLRQQ